MMNFSLTNLGRARVRQRLILLGVICVALVGCAFVRASNGSAASISVVNNSALEIRHLYFSPPDRDDWSADQLDHAVIRTGETFTLNNVSCGQAEIKLIAEDQNGCFVTQVVACGDNSSWTIPAGVTPNCGN
ncbi:MAG: hypothetical protein ACJ74W_04105 [Pyrinomonadaceae bacterium]